MTVGRLLTALSLTNALGSEVPLMSDVRSVQTVSGLAGIAAREVVVVRSGRRGSRNLTRYRDDAQIVINGMLVGADADDLWLQYDAVAGAFASAIDADALLKWTAGNSLMLQRNVRLTSLEAPLEVGPDIVAYQATLRGSDPNVYSQALQTSVAVPLGSTSGGGLTFPRVFPLVFQPPATTVASFVNRGFISTPPVFILRGQLVDPTLQLLPGDLKLVFKGQIGPNDLLTVDVDARTVLLNGTDNRRSMLDSKNSTWFELPPGEGTVTLLSSSFSRGANVSIQWRDARS
jgi:hypothetical protein